MRNTTSSIEEIKEILRDHKEDVIRKFKVSEIGIFGSFVRGEQKTRSDIDIFVEYDEIPDLFEFINLERYLRRLLRKKVDLVRKEAIRPELKEKILREVVNI